MTWIQCRHNIYYNALDYLNINYYTSSAYHKIITYGYNVILYVREVGILRYGFQTNSNISQLICNNMQRQN